MPERLGDAVLELRTDDSAYDRGIARARRRATGLGGVFDRVGRRAAALGRTMALAFAGGSVALFAVVRRAIETADQIGKTAQRIGLSAEALQELRFAARRAGVDLDTFDQALSAMVRRAGEAQRGNEAFAEAFRAVGLSAEELRQLRPEEILRRVADGLARIPNEAEQIAVADQIFSEAGRRIINVLRLTSRGFDAAAAAAHRLGVILTDETIARAARANDELSDMEQVLRLTATAAALELMPAMRRLARAMTDPAFLAGLRETGKLLSRLIVILGRYGQELIAVIGGLVLFSTLSRIRVPPIIAGLLSAFAAAAAAMIDFGGATDETGGAVDELRSQLDSLGGGGGEVDAATQKIGEMTAALENQNFALEQVLGRLRDFPATVGQLRNDIELENAAAAANIDLSTRQGRAWAEAFRRGQDLRRTVADVEQILRTIQTPQEAYNARIARLNELLRQGALNQDQFNRAVAQAGATLERQTAEVQQFDHAVQGLGFQLDSVFRRMIDDLVRGEFSWRSFASTVLQSISRILPALPGLFGAGSAGGGFGLGGGIFSSLLGGLFHAGGVVGRTPVPLRLLPSEVFASAPRLHDGLLPDEFPAVLQRGETVLPAGRQAASTYYIDARGADRGAIADLKQLILGLAGPNRVEERAIGAVVDARRRDPRLFKA